LGGYKHRVLVPGLAIALVLAVVLPALGAPPHRLPGRAVELVARNSPKATTSANATKTAKKALKAAKAADKRAKQAIALARWRPAT
jgi:hypothetical protein